MPDCATPESTLKYSQRFKTFKYTKLANTGLYVSQAGFGSYRIHITIPAHREALNYALQNGINLIDTSSNYADGGSEELIGSVINELRLQGKIEREEIIVVSKAGYLQGQNLLLSQQLKEAGNPFPDLVEYAPNLKHCIHPDFIEDQISQTLNRLKLKTVDFFLLHNPEYYLLWAHQKGIPLKDAQKEMYIRIEKAFLHLELEVQNGRIQNYGISSNSFPLPANRYDFIELEKIWEIAIEISANHHFRVVQFPLNLIERGAIIEKNQTSNVCVLNYAQSKSLAVLINRPLNAFKDNQLARLSSIVLNEKFDQKRLSIKFEQVINLETKFINEVLPKLAIEEDKQKELSGLFSSGQYLKNRYKELGLYWQWIENQARYITDQVSYAVQLINEIQDKEQNVIKWLNDYVEIFNELLGYLTLFYGHISNQTNKKIVSSINSHSHFEKSMSLQNIAIEALCRTIGVSSVLIGMRQKSYVEDVFNFLKPSKTDLDNKFWTNIEF